MGCSTIESMIKQLLFIGSWPMNKDCFYITSNGDHQPDDFLTSSFLHLSFRLRAAVITTLAEAPSSIALCNFQLLLSLQTGRILDEIPVPIMVPVSSSVCTWNHFPTVAPDFLELCHAVHSIAQSGQNLTTKTCLSIA